MTWCFIKQNTWNLMWLVLHNRMWRKLEHWKKEPWICLIINYGIRHIFEELDIDSSLSREHHFHQMMNKLSRASYPIRYAKHFMFQDTIRKIYFWYLHSILSYDIIFWCNSAYSCNIFRIQKRIIRIIMNARNRDSCHQLFKNLKILPPKSQYIFSLSLFVAKNRYIIESNSEIHNINNRWFLTYILQLQT